MPLTWRPTAAGKLFTPTMDWDLTLVGDWFVMQFAGKKLVGPVPSLEGLEAKPGIFWSSVSVPSGNGKVLHIDGISNATAQELVSAVASAVKSIRHQQQAVHLLKDFRTSIQPLVKWARIARDAWGAQLQTKGWLTHEFKGKLNSIKPAGLADLLGAPEVQAHVARQPKELRDAVGLWKRSFDEVADGINQEHVDRELVDFKGFFDKVERSPLTEEQARAVVCFDNRVLLVASAGSGKTSTMVAKVGYALKKGYVGAERMLLLAFNNDAAADLRERMKVRLEPLGLPVDKVVAKSFHAFGLDIIDAATGKRPSIAPWVESGKDLETLLAMVDELKDSNPAFRTDWDIVHLVFGQDLPKFGKERESPEAWNSETRQEGFWTLKDDVVNSRAEQVIANWLFYNGVNYVYEAPYQHVTADPTHRQYHSDFYFPDVDAYLEHRGLEENGEPPPEFTDNKEGMAWEKIVHAEKGTKLLETTIEQLWSGQAFDYLATELTKLGITLDPDPDRPVPGRKPIENTGLARTLLSFLTHAKSNRLSVAGLRKRLDAGAAGNFHYRHAMFLGLFEQVWKAWEDRLKADQCIDFDDMLNLAGDCVEDGRWTSPYELVMVDEFQDASQARARLVAGLVKRPGKCLFAVGDDWQSINRFAGADLAVMTDFEARFGRSVTLKLETTFRCPQSLCDLSSGFFPKNPKQIKKGVRAAKPDIAEPVRIVRVGDETKIRNAVGKRVEEIAAQSADGGKRVRVYVMGRYNRDNAYVPLNYDSDRIEVKFITVHSSKGLEADHIILPRITSETLGFPSRIVDDPVLQLAMPGGDSHEFAEERRLFYVALTRARSTVTLITVAGKESTFIAELARDQRLELRNLDGTESSSELCPGCKEGFLVKKDGRYGPFLSCSRFPKCRHTSKVPGAARQHGYAAGANRRG